MPIKSGFFNSVNGDRKYDASFFAEYFATFISNGVFPNPSNGFQVIANNDMTVTLKEGQAWINGYYVVNDSDYNITIDTADGILNRIDRIVLRFDSLNREITPVLKKGTFASTPVAPTLQRDADAHEIALADVYVAKGAFSISQANVTDQRLNTDLCGVVHGTVDQVDTTTLFNQYQSWFTAKQTEANTDLTTYIDDKQTEINDWYSLKQSEHNTWYTGKQTDVNTWFTNLQTATQDDIDTMEAQMQTDWDTWFATVQGALNGDQAGNLLTMIQDLSGTGRTTETVKGNADAIAAVNQSFTEYQTATEDKIDIVYSKMSSADREIAYLKLKQEAADRIEGGNTFADGMDGNSFGLTLKNAKAKSTVALTAGTTVLNDKLDTPSALNTVSVGDKLTILDDLVSEKVTVTRSETIGETFYLECSPLTNAYKQGAWITESTMNADGTFPEWDGNVTTNTRTDVSVVNSAYDTSGNGGRKLVRLSNGWLVAGTWDGDASFAYVRLWKSTDNGQNWTQLCYISGGNIDKGFAIANKGTDVYVLIGRTDVMFFYKINALTQTDTNIYGTNYQTVDSGQSNINDNVSLAINEAGTELHAVWASKNSSYTTSFNVRYAKGVISGVDGSVTWGAVEQVSTLGNSGYDFKNPSIILDKDGIPLIFVDSVYGFGSTPAPYEIVMLRRDTSLSTYDTINANWSYKRIYSGGSSYAQSSPSAIFVPQSVNGLSQGRIWVAWHGKDATDTTYYNIYVSYSDDGGATWSTKDRLVSSNAVDRLNPSITANKSNEIFALWNHGQGSPRIMQAKWSSGSWGAMLAKTPGEDGLNPDRNPSTLFDLSIDFTEPLFIYRKTSASPKVGFYGTWVVGVLAPLTTATAIYELPSTDYVGAFVQKAGNVNNIDAYINDVLMDESLEGNEYMFTKSLDVATPVKLRLEMARPDTTGGTNDKISRILGGIS